MLRQKVFLLLLVISLAGLFVFPISSGNAATETSEQDTDSSEALTERQRDTLNYANKGFKFFRKGQFKEAITHFNKAIADYNKAIDMKPEDADIYNLRGNAYFKKGRNDKAIDDYTMAIEVKPGLATAYYNRGSTYYFAGKIDMASDDYKKALELNPDYGATNDDREIVCRRQREITGSVLPQKYCATKAQWAAGEIEHEKIPGVTNYKREYPGASLLPLE